MSFVTYVFAMCSHLTSYTLHFKLNSLSLTDVSSQPFAGCVCLSGWLPNSWSFPVNSYVDDDFYSGHMVHTMERSCISNKHLVFNG